MIFFKKKKHTRLCDLTNKESSALMAIAGRLGLIGIDNNSNILEVLNEVTTSQINNAEIVAKTISLLTEMDT